MAFFKRKSVIIKICVLISTILFSALTILLINLNQRHNQQSNIQTSAWMGKGTTDDPYIISSQSDLYTLADEVANGNSYSGVYFKLSGISSATAFKELRPIGCDQNSGASSTGYKVFNGVLDGNGCTLNNLKISIPSTINPYNTSAVDHYSYGLFGVLGGSAKILNLGITNMTISVNASAHNKSMTNICVGAIAGLTVGSPEISNCSIKNVTVTGSNTNFSSHSNTKFPRQNMAGVLGLAQGNTTITNCYVDNFDVDYDDYLNFGSSYTTSQTSGIANISAAFTQRVNNNVVNWSSYDISYNSNSTHEKYEFTSPTSSGNVIVNNNYSNKGDDFKNLGSNLSIGESSENLWYYYPSFNNGWPYLKLFISWFTIEFIDENGNYTAQENNQIIKNIKIPNELSSSLSSKYNSDTLVICDRSIYAPHSENYNVQWDKISSFSSSAKYQYSLIPIELTITIKLNVNGTITQVHNFTVFSGTLLNITLERYGKDGAYKSCRIINSSSSTVCYEYISDNLNYISNVDFISRKIEADTTITITIQEKEYGSLFE